MRRPAFRTDATSERCKAEVRINDVRVNVSFDGLAMSEMAPVTPWMATGANTLNLRVADAEPGADAAVSLLLGEAGAFEASKQDLATLRYSPGKTPSTAGSSPPGAGFGGVSAGPVDLRYDAKAAVVSRRIEAPVPLPRWRWLDSAPMADSPALQDAVFAKYEEIWGLLQGGHFAAMTSLLAERTREYRQALYAGEADVPSDYGLAAAVSKGGLFPLKRRDLDFFLWGDGRLAEFRRWNDRPAIVFNQDGGGHFFRFVFRREGAGFVVAR